MVKKLIITILLISAIFSLKTFAQLSAQISVDHSDFNYCVGDTVWFTNSSSGNYVTSHWFFGDGSDTWTQNPFHIYLTAGSYTVKLVIADTSGNSDSTTITLTINPRPNLNLIDDSQNSRLIARVDDPTNTEFRWYFNNQLTQSTNDTVYYYESGNYAVVATNQYGCSDSASIDITVNNLPSATRNDTLSIQVANNVLTPNNDGINDVLFIVGLSTYTAPCKVLIYNQNGVLVYRNDNYTNLGGFDGHASNGKLLPAGTYYYIITSKGRKTATGFIDLIR